MTRQDLCEGWITARLVDVAELLFGQSPPSSTYNQEGKGLPFFQGKAEFGATYPTVRVWCTEPTRVVEKDDILISVRAPVGPTNLAPYHCAIGRGLAAIRPKIERDFVRYYLKHIEHELASKGTGTTFAAITKDILQNQLIVLAPLNEQRRIVSKIDELFSDLDEGEAALQRVQKLLASYRQAVLKAAVTGELTKQWREANQQRLEPGEDVLQRVLHVRRTQWQGRGRYEEPQAPNMGTLPELPSGWTIATIDQLASAVEYGSSAKCDRNTEGIAVLRMGNIFEGRLVLDDLKYLPIEHEEFPKLLLEVGDLLFNRTNSAELVGKTAVYKGKPDKSSYASYLIKVRFIETESDYISAFINSAYGRDWVRRVVSQQVGQANVNGTKLKALTVPLPPLEEQGEIVQQLDDLFSRIQVLESWCRTELIRSATLRQSILKAAFSGKLVPQDPTDAPASALLQRIQAARQSPSPSKSTGQPSTKTKPKLQSSLWEPS